MASSTALSHLREILSDPPPASSDLPMCWSVMTMWSQSRVGAFLGAFLGAIVERLKLILARYPDIDPYSWWSMHNSRFYWHYDKKTDSMELWQMIHGKTWLSIPVTEIQNEMKEGTL
jgi:hypothetical protein